MPIPRAGGKDQHEVTWRWMNVAGSRKDGTENALDRSRRFACPLGAGLGQPRTRWEDSFTFSWSSHVVVLIQVIQDGRSE